MGGAMRSAMGWVLAGLCMLVAVPGEAQVRPEKSHLVYVARQHDDGGLSDEAQVRCDLAQGCNVAVRLRDRDVDTVHLRVFAEDTGGFSVIPTGEDREGNLAVGRRSDVGWGPRKSAAVIIPVRPLKDAGEDEITMFGIVVREDLAPLAHVLVAVKELRGPDGEAMN